MQGRSAKMLRLGGAHAAGLLASSLLLACRVGPDHASTRGPEGAGGAEAARDGAVPESGAGAATADSALDDPVKLVPAAPTWSGVLPLSPAYVAISAMTVTVDGRIAFVAAREGDAGRHDVVVVIERDGTFAWESDSLYDVDGLFLIPKIASSPTGDLYVVRTIYRENTYDAFISRISLGGKVRWTRAVIPLNYPPPREVIVESLAVDSSGNVFVGGSSDHRLPREIADSAEMGFVARLTANGALDWTARVIWPDIGGDSLGNVYFATGRLNPDNDGDGTGMFATDLVASPVDSRVFFGGTPLDANGAGIRAIKDGTVLWHHPWNDRTLPGATSFDADVDGNLVVAALRVSGASRELSIGRLSGLDGSLL